MASIMLLRVEGQKTGVGMFILEFTSSHFSGNPTQSGIKLNVDQEGAGRFAAQARVCCDVQKLVRLLFDRKYVEQRINWSIIDGKDLRSIGEDCPRG
jgi:hypothetical protein